MLTSEQVSAVNAHVTSLFPDFANCQPKQKQLPNGNYQLSYSIAVTLSTGAQLQRIVRVQVSSTGKIMKISTSR